MNKFTAAAANIAFFLLERTGSVLGQWSGAMTAAKFYQNLMQGKK